MVRISKFLLKELKNASKVFRDCEIYLFGSRLDDSKRGGDFDLAIVGNISEEEFKKKRVQFFKYLLLRDLDLPIDLVFYNKANKLLQDEIKKGVKL